MGLIESLTQGGWISSAILLALTITLAILNNRQTRWEGAAKALQTENETVRNRCADLDADNKRLIAENSDLKAKVDLTPIKIALEQLNSSVQSHKEESTRMFTEMLRTLQALQRSSEATQSAFLKAIQKVDS